ncbi:MAG: bis-aminopropyl spermidine synthase family protein [Candidatus Omnitrophota bacterium]
MNNSHPSSSLSSMEFLAELAQSVQLREGAEGVSKALWSLFRGRVDSTRAWSRELHIPIPVLAALRRELEKRDILQIGKGFVFTANGRQRLEGMFSGQTCPDSLCSVCQGRGAIFPPELTPVLEEFRVLCEKRPEADVSLDQSHATPETCVRKAFLLLEKGVLASSIFFLGDDDMISIACWLMRKHFLPRAAEAGKIAVLELDRRYLDAIKEISHGDVETCEYDAREELPAQYGQSFAVALTDPAYTENALTVFSYRCLCALQAGGTLLLSLPLPDSSNLQSIQLQLLQMGFAIREILPRFNEYIGASIHAHVSSLFCCERVGASSPEKIFTLRYTPFYTGDDGLPGGVYECALCSAVQSVGPGCEFLTIQDLKKAGCHECGHYSFRRAGSRSRENAGEEMET